MTLVEALSSDRVFPRTVETVVFTYLRLNEPLSFEREYSIFLFKKYLYLSTSSRKVDMNFFAEPYS